jgi:hypothetical protein
MREYGKVFSRIWESPDFRALSEDGRTLALYLLTCQHGTIAGLFRVPDGYASEDLQWGSERVSEGFRNLAENGFATRCEVTKWVWITKYLQHNPPENPNQGKAIRRVVEMVPAACCWLARFHREIGPAIGLAPAPEPAAAPEPLSNPSETLSESGTGTGVGIEDLSVPTEPPASADADEPTARVARVAKPEGKAPTIPCPYDRIVALYHEALPELPRVVVMSPARQRAMRKLWAWVLTSRRAGGERRAESAEAALEWLGAYFARAQTNDFLMGRTLRGAGHENWTADFDFLLTERGMRHVIEKTREAA